ncbi:hypothetical protein [Xanthobacter agilis]|uniref:hypothetical protein n=1 Tax=Xanthobacter agilis TaxID=47492 RepID=UPI00372A0E20
MALFWLWDAACAAIGRSCRGCPTKIHVLADGTGRPCVPMLTPGNWIGPMRYLRGGEGYDSDRLSCLVREVGATLITSGRCSQQRTIQCAEKLSQGRHLIENGLYRFEDFRRVHTREAESAADFSRSQPLPSGCACLSILAYTKADVFNDTIS